MIQQFAVIGRPVEHSLSPQIHRLFAAQNGISLEYGTLLGDEAGFARQLRIFFGEGGTGLNVTLPFKEQAFALAQWTTDRCKQVRAANTLWFAHGQLQADNTDGVGLIRDLKRQIKLPGKSILIIGAGGAARGISGALLEHDIAKLAIFNRSPERLRNFIADFPDAMAIDKNFDVDKVDILINATSSSINNEALELPDSIWEQQPFCYDLAYQNHGLTRFCAQAQEHQCPHSDGLGMLVEQAGESFYIWHAIRPKTAPVLHYLRAEIQAKSHGM